MAKVPNLNEPYLSLPFVLLVCHSIQNIVATGVHINLIQWIGKKFFQIKYNNLPLEVDDRKRMQHRPEMKIENKIKMLRKYKRNLIKL